MWVTTVHPSCSIMTIKNDWRSPLIAWHVVTVTCLIRWGHLASLAPRPHRKRRCICNGYRPHDCERMQVVEQGHFLFNTHRCEILQEESRHWYKVIRNAISDVVNACVCVCVCGAPELFVCLRVRDCHLAAELSSSCSSPSLFRPIFSSSWVSFSRSLFACWLFSFSLTSSWITKMSLRGQYQVITDHGIKVKTRRIHFFVKYKKRKRHVDYCCIQKSDFGSGNDVMSDLIAFHLYKSENQHGRRQEKRHCACSFVL